MLTKILTKIPVVIVAKILTKIPVVILAKIFTKISVVILTKILAKIPVVIVTKNFPKIPLLIITKIVTNFFPQSLVTVLKVLFVSNVPSQSRCCLQCLRNTGWTLKAQRMVNNFTTIFSFYFAFNLEYNSLQLTRWQLQRCPSCLSQKLWLNFILGLCVILVCFKIIITEYSDAPFHAPVPTPSPTNNKLQLITEPFYLASSYLAIIEWSWVGYEKFCKSRRVLFTEADCFIIHLKLFQV